jgi:hypothetical protein
MAAMSRMVCHRRIIAHRSYAHAMRRLCLLDGLLDIRLAVNGRWRLDERADE